MLFLTTEQFLCSLVSSLSNVAKKHHLHHHLSSVLINPLEEPAATAIYSKLLTVLNDYAWYKNQTADTSFDASFFSVGNKSLMIGINSIEPEPDD
jgi:hypothetical protein